MSVRSAPRALLSPALAIIVLAVGGCGAARPTSGPSSSTTSRTPASAPLESAQTAVIGYVQQVYPTGDFVLDSGQVSYTVVMSPTTMVVNQRGRAISRLFIRAPDSVQVTGVLVGS